MCNDYIPACGGMSFGGFIKPFTYPRAVIYWMTCILTSRCTVHGTLAGCHLQRAIQSGLSSDGDILIGGIFAIHDARIYQTITFTEEPAKIRCQKFMSENFQWLQAMIFTIMEINRNQALLPNTTLGFQIHDSCMVMQRSLEGTIWMLTGHEKPIPNYQCWKNRPPVAIVGDATSGRSISIARILGLYRHPQISYYASIPLLSDRNQFPSFFRTVPSDDFQSRGLAQLLLHFGWTWVGLLADDDDYGQQGIRIVHEELLKAKACVAFSENIVISRADKNAFHIVQVIKNSTANAIVIFSGSTDVVVVLDEMLRQNATGRILVATEDWATSTVLIGKKYTQILSGAIGFEIHSGEMPGFEEYLTRLHPSNFSNLGLFREFWEETFHCQFQQGQEASLNVLHNNTKLCSGEEKLQSNQINPSSVTSFGIPYKIYNAVYAIALALQDLRFCKPEERPVHHETCVNIKDFQPWQLLHYIKKVHLQEKQGGEPFFDEHGNPPAKYDIINWQMTVQGILQPIKVGEYDSSARARGTLIVNSSAIRWTAGDTKVPVSVCSRSCPTGSRKVAKERQPVCCFLCIPCLQGEISNHTDSIKCLKCPWDQWSNQNQDSCIPKIIEFLYYDEHLGVTLAATSILFSMTPITILGLFIYYRKTAIVKANNCNISYLLLLSLALCFLCSLAFIGYPTNKKCLFRQVAFGIIFALCVSCILAKTIMVVFAFNATKPNTNLRKWVGPQLSYILISVCMLIQFIICIFWLILYPPYPQFNIFSKLGTLIVECNEGSAVAFWVMLGYLGLLAFITLIVAFLARKLPDSFNEAKFITFSMLAFLSVWISFIPAYFSTRGKYMVAMEIFAILTSSSSLVSCIFFPKCYIILVRPEMNTKHYLMGRGQHQNTKMKRM